MPLMSVLEVAAKLNKSTRTITRMIAAGKLSGVEINGKTMVQYPDDPGVPVGKEVVQVSPNVLEELALYKERAESLSKLVTYLEREQERLWSMIQSSLPAPKTYNQGMPVWIAVLTIVLAVIATILIVTSYR